MTSKRAGNVNEVLAQELHKPVIKKVKRRKVYSMFKDNIGAADLTVMVSLSFFNHGIEYLLCVINVLTRKGIVCDDFIGIVDESKCKPNKL